MYHTHQSKKTNSDELKKEPKQTIIVRDPSSKKSYLKGNFLGKGGFAKCYELTDTETKRIYAGKIVSKDLLTKQHQRDKMTQEINIHRDLSHRHVVGFHGFFEDSSNVYILLELCRRRSLMELHKRRKAITEPECRYFVRQIVLAVDYLHKHKIIHRDLKLGNLFLNDEMEIKIGDFGLATHLEYDGERKRTLCGTPNYIAPEVLGKTGHSYQVDAWSLGCIIYTLLVGKPPFETTCLKNTYTRIKNNEYNIPQSRMSEPARQLIIKLLRADPDKRPTMEQVLQDAFFTSGFLPAALPTSCLTMAPRFDQLKPAMPVAESRRPLTDVKNGVVPNNRPPTGLKALDINKEYSSTGRQPTNENEPVDCYLTELLSQLTSVITAKPSSHDGYDEAEEPASTPIYWVGKWVDYSDKYGLGYQLCDNSMGVLYNDSTRLILTNTGENIQYIERNGTEHFHTLKEFPDSLNKKVTLLRYFRNYMSEHLLKAGANMTPRDGEEMTRLPFLRTWFRTRSAIVLHLSNGTLQINFFQDHTKIILCPLMNACTYIDEKKQFRTYQLSKIEVYGCCKELATRLRYARTMVERLLSSKSGSSAAAALAASSGASSAQTSRPKTAAN